MSERVIEHDKTKGKGQKSIIALHVQMFDTAR